MKHHALLFLPVALALAAGTALSIADDNLLAPPPTSAGDRHLSWHEFRHELGAYPQVTSSMSREGVVWISGHVNDGIERNRIEKLARKIRGATDIRSQLQTD